MPTAFPDVLPDTESETRVKRQPPYAVVLHNDDRNTMDYVALVLRKVFSYAAEKCVTLMLEAHEKGKAVVWVGPLEVAELKADQMHGCGGDPARPGADRLRVTLEPAA